MKKIFVSIIFLITTLFSIATKAQNAGINFVSVEEAFKLNHGTQVVLEGEILRQAGKTLYKFKDETGEVYIEIPEKSWNGVDVGPNEKIQILGNVFRGQHSIKIDVTKIIKL
ncbi:MAG: NirD/YgiW/YdeI family stress tolerance protein [Alphaproteobacteria bacterium]|nr:NirD/YgiW/YdeI family stress tolerance protein [Alphaproteobacteria bacterium]